MRAGKKRARKWVIYFNFHTNVFLTLKQQTDFDPKIPYLEQCVKDCVTDFLI